MSEPIDPRVESIRLLRSIDTTLKALLLVVSEDRGEAPAAGVASDADLDGAHGDPTIKAKDPRDWSGPSMIGKKFSECPADYLELLADRYTYFAGKEEDPKKANYNRLDAKRALGWAARIRAGKHTPPPAEAQGGLDDTWTSDVGF